MPTTVEAVLRLLGGAAELLSAGHTAAPDEIANPKTTHGKRPPA